MDKIDVVHFVTGGFSGATAVARQLVQQANQSAGEQHLLVLRKKRQTRVAQLQQLTDQQIPYLVVPGWSHLATILSLMNLLKRLKPRVLIAHGFSEHLWGRLAAVIAGVPVIIHVEHNSKERYTPMRLWLAKKLAVRTRWLVGVSEGVKNSLLAYGFPAEKCVFVNNGIDLLPYKNALDLSWSSRIPGIVMCARFARQKDHATLLHALALLKDNYQLTPPLILIGGGKASLRRRNEQLAQELGVHNQVQFLGYVNDVPSLLKKYTISVLSTHYEGFGLVLAEAMAAGCFVIGSAVPGVQEWLAAVDEHFIVPAADAIALADRIAWVLQNPAIAEPVAQRGHLAACDSFGLRRMYEEYKQLIS
ncbi:MAG TPA: glycosyltransferase [Cellvibrionaceae bacterium]